MLLPMPVAGTPASATALTVPSSIRQSSAWTRSNGRPGRGAIRASPHRMPTAGSANPSAMARAPTGDRAAVGVGDQDDLGVAGLDGRVERLGLAPEVAGGVGDAERADAPRRPAGGDRRGPVGRVVVGDHDRQPVGRVVLGQERVDAPADARLLVARRDHHGDRWQVGGVGEPGEGARAQGPRDDGRHEQGVAAEHDGERGDHGPGGRAGNRQPAAAKRGSASSSAAVARPAGGPSCRATTDPGRASPTTSPASRPCDRAGR